MYAKVENSPFQSSALPNKEREIGNLHHVAVRKLNSHIIFTQYSMAFCTLSKVRWNLHPILYDIVYICISMRGNDAI